MSKLVNITASDHFIIGEDKNIVFDIVDVSGNTQTMTGWALEFVVREFTDSESAILTKTTGGGTISISNGSGTDDRATITITDDDTINLAPKTYQYSLRRTDAGNEQVLAYGQIVLVQSASR